MKKRLARLAAVVMSVMMIGSLAACGSGDGGSGDGGSASKEGIPSKLVSLFRRPEHLQHLVPVHRK